MNTLKKARLQQHGWAVGETAEFLNLTPQEAQFVELKLALAAGVRQLREQRGMTQAALAEQLGSSQSRVAKMEAADRSVTVDLMIATTAGDWSDSRRDRQLDQARGGTYSRLGRPESGAGLQPAGDFSRPRG